MQQGTALRCLRRIQDRVREAVARAKEAPALEERGALRKEMTWRRYVAQENGARSSCGFAWSLGKARYPTSRIDSSNVCAMNE